MDERPKKVQESASHDVSLALIKLEENLKKFKMKSSPQKSRGSKRKKEEPPDLNRAPRKVEEIIDPETLAEIKSKYKPMKTPFAERHKMRNIDERVKNVELALQDITKAVDDPNFGKEENLVVSVEAKLSQEPAKIYQPKQYHSSMAMAMQDLFCETILNEPDRPEEKKLRSNPPIPEKKNFR